VNHKKNILKNFTSIVWFSIKMSLYVILFSEETSHQRPLLWYMFLVWSYFCNRNFQCIRNFYKPLWFDVNQTWMPNGSCILSSELIKSCWLPFDQHVFVLLYILVEYYMSCFVYMFILFKSCQRNMIFFTADFQIVDNFNLIHSYHCLSFHIIRFLRHIH
jgi:hypothetical protein